MAGGAGGNLPGLRMERLGATVVLNKRGLRRLRCLGCLGAGAVDSLELRLDVPGTVEAPRGAWTLSAQGPIATPASIERDAERKLWSMRAVSGRI